MAERAVMARGLNRLIVAIAVACGAAALSGCQNGVTAPPRREPLAPETELTYAPLEGDTASFRIRFFWNGYDRDGEVVRFRFAVDEDTLKPSSEWISTTAKDTTLLFLVDPVKLIKGHVFWIVAEDNDGRQDPTPAKRFFSARTLPPTSKIERGPSSFGSIIGPNFTFEWSGIDPDGGETGGPAPVDSFEYLLLQLGAVADTATPPTHPQLPTNFDQNFFITMINEATGPCLPPPHDDWCWQGIRGLRNRFRNVTPAGYVFAIRAVDIAGATEKNLAHIRNIRYFNVTNRNPGPILTIEISVANIPLPPASGAEDIVRREIQIFEGETVSFAWEGDASAYGGEIVGYTYALDDTTTAEWGSINILKTSVTLRPSELTAGIHFFYIRCVDDGGLITNARIPLKIVPPTFKDPSAPRRLLFVDDFQAPGAGQSGSPNYPSDEVERLWWEDKILIPLGNEFGITFEEFDTWSTSLEGRLVPTPEVLSSFRTVIWNVDLASPTALGRTLVGGNYSELSGYLRAGGTIVITGFQLGYNTGFASTVYENYSRGMCVLDQSTPGFKLSYFPRTFMGIDGALESPGGVRSNGVRDFVQGRPTPEGLARGYQLAEVDTGGPGTGAKWDPYAFPGDLETALSPGLPSIDGWRLQQNFACQQEQGRFRREDPFSPIAVPILTYHGVNVGVAQNLGPSPREGLVVGIQTQAHDLGNAGGGDPITPGNSGGAVGRLVFLGFPLYYVKDAQAYALMQNAFNYVDHSPTIPQNGP